MCQFYDTNMENNTTEDWLKLLLYTTCQDKELLSKVLARARTLETAQNVIDYVEAEECGRVNTERLLGGKAIAAVVRVNWEMPITGFPSALFVRNRDIPNKSVWWRNLSCIASIVKRELTTTRTVFVRRSSWKTKIKLRKVIINLVTKRKPTRPVL